MFHIETSLFWSFCFKSLKPIESQTCLLLPPALLHMWCLGCRCCKSTYVFLIWLCRAKKTIGARCLSASLAPLHTPRPTKTAAELLYYCYKIHQWKLKNGLPYEASHNSFHISASRINKKVFSTLLSLPCSRFFFLFWYLYLNCTLILDKSYSRLAGTVGVFH